MSQIERYYGVTDAITTPTLLVSVDTRVMDANRSFTIDILYGGRETANATQEQTWLYRYIITCVNLDSIVQILDTHNVMANYNNYAVPISSSINSDVFVNLYVDMTNGGSGTETMLTTYDCSLNYV
jgi:hypothetical protein